MMPRCLFGIKWDIGIGRWVCSSPGLLLLEYHQVLSFLAHRIKPIVFIVMVRLLTPQMLSTCIKLKYDDEYWGWGCSWVRLSKLDVTRVDAWRNVHIGISIEMKC